ncbi:MAG TPA: polysaccharide biosynthesis/export family protein [Rhodocyclaceae bacterium]
MSRLLAVRILFVAALFIASAWAADPEAPQSKAPENVYRLCPGDAVFVSVWKEESLQKEVHVLPDGSITFPLAGRVKVSGLGTVDAEKAIAEKLKEFVPDPIVTLVVTGIEGNRVYVLGKVVKPGPVVMSGPTTILNALSLAGGLDKFADEGAIKVVHGTEIIPVNYRDLVSGRSMATNRVLEAGDTVLVP